MAENGTATFDNPDDYQAGIGGASVNLIVTGGGDFNARLTWLNLRRIHVLRASENLPRIAFFSLSPACFTAAVSERISGPIQKANGALYRCRPSSSPPAARP